MDCVNQLVDLASQFRLANITYRKPQEKEPTVRGVEAYAFLESQAGNLSVKCWQVAPSLEGGNCWRAFRCDRILAVDDAGVAFEPRRRVTLVESVVFDFPGRKAKSRAESAPAPSPAMAAAADVDFATSVGMESDHWYQLYVQEVERCLFDGLLTSSEIDTCFIVGENLAEEEKRAAHAQIFSDVLQDVMLDGRIDDDECHFIEKMRGFLSTLGWAP